MTKEVKMPEISEDADSGTVVEILVQEGDTIEAEQSIIAVESDKASVEVPSTESGTVKEIKIAEGDEVKVGEVILVLETNGEADDEDEDDAAVAEGEEEKNEKKQQQSSETKTSEGKEDPGEEKDDEAVSAKAERRKEEKPKQPDEPGKGKSEIQDTDAASDVPAAPSVRRIARELGVNIREVKGSGPGNRITAEDVQAQANGKQKEQPREAAPKTTQEKPLPDFSKWGDISREKMSGIRKATVGSMSDAWQTVPHVTQFDKADITQLEEYTEKYKAKVEKAGGKLTVTAIMMKVAVAALRAFPKFNASIDAANEEVIFKNYYHIGVAADTEKGLLVPVIRDVDRKSVIKLSTELPEIAQKAREGKLSGDEMKGGTFTISNLGGIGGTNFTPIVYKPQVAILGISRTQTEPVYRDGSFQPRSMLPLSLSYDHRLIDGAEAARFLRFICQSLEDPFVMLMEG